MTDALIRAIRARNLDQASHAIARLQRYMSNEGIKAAIIAAVEHLAWEEGDRSAAKWLLRHPQHLSRRQ